jgi:DNA modification methylase
VACASGPGDLVVDPLAGSGTAGAACVELGRRFIGIEQSERWAGLARERLASITPRPAIA